MRENITLKNIDKAAQKFINNMNGNKIFSFNGKMGAGKTTFIKAICNNLGVKENVNSPTFSIVNEYETNDKRIIYHFDFYRINNIQEAIDLGAEEYLYSGNICFIEWAENVTSLLPDSTVEINIEEQIGGVRIIYST